MALHYIAAMRFGMNLLLWTTHVTKDHERQLAFVKECGFDGVRGCAQSLARER